MIRLPMKPRWRRPWLVLALTLSLAWLCAHGCGIKTDPLPAPQLLPARVSAPTYQFTEDGLFLVDFKPPTKNVRGALLKDLGGFYVDRSENLLDDDFCADCPVTFTKRIDLKAQDPSERDESVDVTYRFEDQLKPGYVYHYRIYAHNSKGTFDPGEFASLKIFYNHPALPPETIQVRTEEDIVFLSWPPSNRTVEGRGVTDLAGYDIYRKENDGAWVKLNPDAPWPNTTFEDTRVVFENDYSYKIRAVREWHDTRIDGPPSRSVSVNLLDLTPPPPPVNVFSASAREGIKLTWPAVEASDLAGYRVYRRENGTAHFRRIGPELLTDNLFVDTDVRQGATYFYRVTSVDGSPAANESKPTVENRIRYEP
jgi:hypothetical protein